MPQRTLVSFAFALMLSGCAAVGVVSSSDPLKKLNDAQALFESQGRPVPAEFLIREAADIYRKRQDMLGQGHAYREYGELLISKTVVQWEVTYRREGFRDKSVTYDNRHNKAAEYFQMALDSYRKAESGLLQSAQYDLLTNLYLNMGLSNHYLGSDADACSYYTKMVDASVQNRQRNPAIAPSIERVEAMVSNVRAAARCT